MFCQNFELIEDAMNHFYSDSCKDCNHLVYQNGMMECELITAKIIPKKGVSNEQR